MKLSVIFASVAAAGPLRNTYINPALASVTERDATPQPLSGLPEVNPQKNVVQRSLQARAPQNPPAGTEFYMTNPDQWDQTPGREKDSERVRVAWDMALELIQSSIKRLDELNKDVNTASNTDDIKLGRGKKPRTAADQKKRLRQFIAKSDPAYTQIFGAALENIDDTRKNFQKVLDGVTKQNADGRSNRPIYLTTLKAPMALDGKEDYCKSDKPGSQGTQAFVIQVKNLKYFVDLKKVTSAPTGPIPHDDAWVINFCDQFFKTQDLTDRLNVLKQDPGKKDDICNLDHLDTTARILLHEWTHLDFTLDTNSGGTQELKDDWVGWDAVASRSTSGGKSSAQPNKWAAFSSKNADSYAWYATYNYMNELAECKGVHWKKTAAYTAADCNADVWPPSKDKYVKNSW